MTDRYDAVIVGGGHNGLVCACYLARAGLSVCVLERRNIVGGAAVTEEFWPGFRNSAASYTVGLLRQQILDDLDLHARGLKIIPRPVQNFVPSSSGPGLLLHKDVAASQAAIRPHSSRDARRYPDFVAELGRISRLVGSLLLEAPVDPSGGFGEGLRALRRLPRLRGLRPADWLACWTLLTGSAGRWLERWFESELLKGGLGFDAVVGHFSGPFTPGSGYLLLHHALGDLRHLNGAWGHAVGGMGAVTQALAEKARAGGVDIRLDTPVESIEPVPEGFEVHAGANLFRADVVAGAVAPTLLFGPLVGAEHLPQAFVQRMGEWRSESATFRANLALSELPDFRCLPGRTAASHHGSGILIAPGLDYLDRAYNDALAHGVSGQPVIELLIPSTLDDTLAPAGCHVASVFCQHFRYALPDGSHWSELREPMLQRVIDTITEYAPNFRNSLIGAEAYSPLDLERRFSLPGGDIFHGAMTLDQLYWARPAFGYAQYRTPLKGLYLCASGAHPGGGVSGAPGYNAARAIIADLKSRRWRWRRVSRPE